MQLGKFPLKRIAILRALPGIGDFLCTIPALRSLRVAFPQAEITLIGLPSVKQLVERFSYYIDRLIEFPGYPGLSEVPLQPEKIPPFLSQLQNEHFDLAIQMQGSGIITNPLTMLLGSRFQAGFFVPGQYCPNETWFLPYHSHESEVRRYLRLIEHLGVACQGKELEFPLWEEDKQALLAIEEARYLLADEYVCIHPGASNPTRRWSPEGFATVADAIAACGLKVVLTGSPQEVDIANAVAAMMNFPSLNLAGRTNLGALAVLLKNSRLLVCNYTGVFHLAAALSVQSVTIFTQSEPNCSVPLDTKRHRVVCDTSEITPLAAIAQALNLLEEFATDIPSINAVQLATHR